MIWREESRKGYTYHPWYVHHFVACPRPVLCVAQDSIETMEELSWVGQNLTNVNLTELEINKRYLWMTTIQVPVQTRNSLSMHWGVVWEPVALMQITKSEKHKIDSVTLETKQVIISGLLQPILQPNCNCKTMPYGAKISFSIITQVGNCETML
jgi:hypothetical protein